MTPVPERETRMLHCSPVSKETKIGGLQHQVHFERLRGSCSSQGELANLRSLSYLNAGTASILCQVPASC